MSGLAAYELGQIKQANDSGRKPLESVHGLWLLPSSWYPWKQRRNPGVTEIVKVPDRGHSLTIDHGWKQVADIVLALVQRCARH